MCGVVLPRKSESIRQATGDAGTVRREAGPSSRRHARPGFEQGHPAARQDTSQTMHGLWQRPNPLIG